MKGEIVHVIQVEGFEEDDDLVCLLLRALYGLKQSPALWQETLQTFMVKIGFIPSLLIHKGWHYNHYLGR
jgi:hypothetical protein